MSWYSLTEGTLLHDPSSLAGLKFENIDTLKTIHDGFTSGRRVCVVGGGETTVKVKGGGKGGRNQEMVLAFSLAASSLLSRQSRCVTRNVFPLTGILCLEFKLKT